MLLVFDAGAGNDGVDAVLVGASVGVADDNLNDADGIDVISIDDISSLDGCESDETATIDAVTDEDGAAVVDNRDDTVDVGADVNVGSVGPVCG